MAITAPDCALVDNVMGTVPTTRFAIFAVLEEHGPLHTAAIAKILQKDQRTVASSIRIAHHLKLVHISGWKRSLGTKGRWGAIYAMGRGQDRKPPQVDVHKQANERYREKYRKVLSLRARKRRGQLPHPWFNFL